MTPQTLVGTTCPENALVREDTGKTTKADDCGILYLIKKNPLSMSS